MSDTTDPTALRRELDAALAAGAADSDMLDLRASLAAALMANGDAVPAVDQLETVVRIRLLHDGAGDPETLNVLGMLGRALTEARRYAQAESVLTDVVRGRTRVLGPEHPQTLVARGNLLRAIGRSGRPEEALTLADALIERCRARELHLPLEVCSMNPGG